MKDTVARGYVAWMLEASEAAMYGEGEEEAIKR